MKLVVNAPKAEVTNNAVFKEIEIQAVADNTFIEKVLASLGGNMIVIVAPKVHIVIAEGAKTRNIKFNQGTGAGKSAKLEVAGEIESVNVDAATDLAVDVQGKGTLTQLTVAAANTNLDIKGGADKNPVKVTVTETAAGSTVKSDVKTEVTLNAEVAVELTEGAKGSTITAGKAVEGKELDIKNKTGDSIDLISSNGSKTPIINNNTGAVKIPVIADDATNPSKPSVPNFDQNGSDANKEDYTNEKGAVNVANAKVTSEDASYTVAATPSGSAGQYTVSGSALKLTIGGINAPDVKSGCVIRYDVAWSGLGTKGTAVFLNEKKIDSGVTDMNAEILKQDAILGETTRTLETINAGNIGIKCTETEDKTIKDEFSVTVVAYVVSIEGKLVKSDNISKTTVELKKTIEFNKNGGNVKISDSLTKK